MIKKWNNADIKKAREDFRAFVYIVWNSISLPEPTPIQLDIADYLQKPVSDRIIIEGFRGVAKSFLTCTFAVWTLWKQRQHKILIISASKDRADGNARFVKKIINTIPFLSDMVATKDLLDTQNMFDVGGVIPDISPSVKSVGITGQITGSRADMIIADDIEIPKNSATQLQRDKLSEAVKEFDAILKPNGRIIYLGTPQTESSLYNALQTRGYTARVWPVLYPTEEELLNYDKTLAPYIKNRLERNTELAGTPTDSKRFDELEIEKRRLSYGKAGFALQFMLNTNLSDAERYPLKVSDFIVESLDMEQSSVKWAWSNSAQQRIQDIPCVALRNDYYYEPLSRSSDTMAYTGTVMAIDGSGRGTDETAYAVVKYLNGYLHLMEVGGYKEGYSDSTMLALAMKAKFWKVNEIVLESNFGDGMFTKLLTPVFIKNYPCTITEVRNMKQKEERIIDTLEPVLMQHRLIVNKSVIEQDYKVYEADYKYSLIYQLTRLCRERNALAHDDRLDALTMAVSYWLEQMDIETDSNAAALTAYQLECMMEDTINYMTNTTTTRHKFISNMQTIRNFKC